MARLDKPPSPAKPQTAQSATTNTAPPKPTTQPLIRDYASL